LDKIKICTKKKFIQKYIGEENTINQALLQACNVNDFCSILRLLAQGADVNYIYDTETQTTLLHKIVTNLKLSHYILTLFAINGARSTPDIKGWTPLFYCAQLNRPLHAGVLLKYGTTSTEDKQGKTPLDIATNLGHKAVIKILSMDIMELYNEMHDISQSSEQEQTRIEEYKSSINSAIDTTQQMLQAIRKDLYNLKDEAAMIDLVKKIRLIKMNLSVDDQNRKSSPASPVLPRHILFF